MLRFSLFSLAAILVCVIAFGFKAHSIHQTKIDQVSSVEAFMAAH